MILDSHNMEKEENSKWEKDLIGLNACFLFCYFEQKKRAYELTEKGPAKTTVC